jgi:general stress protein 26
MSNNREVDYDGDSWFTCDDANMVAEIEAEPRVGLSFQGKAGMLGLRPFLLAVEGRAELIRDKGSFAEHWTSGLDRWFEEGIDTPGLMSSRSWRAYPRLGRRRRRRDPAGKGRVRRRAVTARAISG